MAVDLRGIHRAFVGQQRRWLVEDHLDQLQAASLHDLADCHPLRAREQNQLGFCLQHTMLKNVLCFKIYGQLTYLSFCNVKLEVRGLINKTYL